MLRVEKTFSGFFIYLSILIGIILKFINLLKNNPLGFDEAVIWTISTISVKNLISGNYFDIRFHPPVFYLLIHFWRIISDSEIWLRLPSLTASIISIFLIYIFLKNLFDKKIAVMGTFLYSTSTFTVWWSSQLRVYPLLFMVSLLYLITYIKFFKKSNKILLFLLFLIGIVGFYLDYSFIWVFLSVNLHFILINIKEPKNLLKLVLFDVLSLSVITPYLFKTANALISYPIPSKIPVPNIYTLNNMFSELIFSEKFYFLKTNPSLYIIFNIFLFILIALIIKEFFSKNREKLFTSILVLLPLISSFILSQKFSIFVSRNLFIVNLGLISLLAISIRKLLKFPIMTALIVVSWISFNGVIISQSYRGNPNWEMAADFFHSNPSLSGAKIIFLPNWFQASFKYYNLKYKFINSDKQIINTSSSLQTYKLAQSYYSAKINHCVVYDTTRKIPEDNFDQFHSKIAVLSFFNQYPVMVNIDGGINFFCIN